MEDFEDDISGILHNLKEDAKSIKGWEKLSKTEVANKYCEYDAIGDEYKRDKYFSVLMIKYWYMINWLYDTSKSTRLEKEDMVSWLAESLMIGLKYRRWKDPSYEVSKLKNGAEVVFNQCITSTRQRYYKHFNQLKRKLNFSTFSLDEAFENIGEFDEDFDSEFDIEEESHQESDDKCREVVNYYFSKGKPISAFIVDGICFFDSQVCRKYDFTYTQGGETKTIKRVRDVFSPNKLLLHLKELGIDYTQYFKDNYNVSNRELNLAYTYVHSVDNKRLSTIIDETLNDLRTNKELKEILC